MKRNKTRRRENYDDKPIENASAIQDAPWRAHDPEAAREAQRYANPLPSRTHIQQTIADAASAPTLDELIASFELKKLNEQEALAKRLVAMTRDGQLAMDRYGAYIVPHDAADTQPVERETRAHERSRREGKAASEPKRTSASAESHPSSAARAPKMPATGTVDGKVSAHRDGYGFLSVEGSGADVFLPPHQMKGLIDGDRARVRVTGEDAKGRREGVLVEVLERGTRQWVGRFQASGARGGLFTVIPSSPKLPEVIVSNADRNGAQAGQMVLVELTSPINDRSGNLPIGRVIEVLGEHLAPGMEIQAAIRTHNLPYEWPEGVEAEAAAYGASVTAQQCEGRVDLRKLGLMTIDGADARDFDDAVYAEPVRGWRGGGWKLWVAIADVSAYVRPGTKLDAEATKRGTSVYFPENVIPMLPEALSNGLCSLNPEVDRLCMVCEMRVSPDGEVGKAKFYEAVMRSQARLIYDDVAEILADPNGKKAQTRAALVPALQNLKSVFEALFAAREKRGAIDFEGTETKIVFGTDRKIEKIVPVKRNLAHRLIEECMIAANVEAAKLVDKHKMPALYRIHESPDAEKVAVLREFLAGRALRLPGGTVPSAKDYAAALAQLKGREDAGIVQNVMLRSLMQAKYSPDNVGHFGLALTHYAHFTSPIRRYPDLLLHRALKHVLIRGKIKDFEYTQQQMELLGAHCSTAERRADDATRDVSTWLKCEFMSHRVGDEFDGVVTSVAPFGLFVELEELFIDGLIHVSNLVGDFYEFDAKHQRLVGSRSKRVYALGDPLRVKLMRVSLDERKIDLEEVPSKQRPGEKRGRGEAAHKETPRDGRSDKAGKSGKAGKSSVEAAKSGAGKPGQGRRGRRR